VADERSVDVDERRDTPPQPGSGPTLPIIAAVKLSPVQEAYGDYARHFAGCTACRDIDQTRCDDAEHLYRAWRELTDDAYRRLAAPTDSVPDGH
jgi:hypothetical protein